MSKKLPTNDLSKKLNDYGYNQSSYDPNKFRNSSGKTVSTSGDKFHTNSMAGSVSHKGKNDLSKWL